MRPGSRDISSHKRSEFETVLGQYDGKRFQRVFVQTSSFQTCLNADENEL